jgi:hypothetical protein
MDNDTKCYALILLTLALFVFCSWLLLSVDAWQVKEWLDAVEGIR